MIKSIFHIFILTRVLLTVNGQDSDNGSNGASCVNQDGQPQICYPPFENYASAGRKVIATNTCGLRGRQKYCIGLSSAEMRTRCDYCDNRNVSERHSADYLTDQNPNNWWQSETVADNRELFYQQSINLTLNLGKQFHVTFINLQFKSPRPSAMILYRKFDDNSPWEPWQYFSSNCKKHFNMTFKKGYFVKKHDEVLCTEDFSSLNEFYNGIVMFATIYGRPGSENFFSNKNMMDWATASQIKIEMRKMHTFGEQNDEEELLLTYFYAIKNLQVAARCWCNGHGNECRKSTGEGLEPQLYCVCHPSHHTTGQSCERCENFYQDRPWNPATSQDANICQRCMCNENADSCVFNEELYIKSGNLSGGLCLNCKGNTKGPHCEVCLDGFYRNPKQPKKCIPCNCDPVGRASEQCDNNGVCLCQPGVEGDKCTRCKVDHFNFGSRGCQPCNCNLPGVNITERLFCNPSTGICYCKKNVIGEKCDRCIGGFFSLSANDPLGCRPCFCFAHTKECTMASGYLLTEIDSEFGGTVDDWVYGIGNQPPMFNPMLDPSTNPSSISWFLGREPWRDDYFFYAPRKFLGDRRLSYNLDLILTLSFKLRPDYNNFNSKWVTMITDVQLMSEMLSVSVPFDIGGNPFPDTDGSPKVYRFRLNEESGFWRDRMDYFRFHSILSNLTAIKIRLTNPTGYVKLHRVALQTALDRTLVNGLNLSLPDAISVEHCNCPPQYRGLSCENCASGYHREYSKGTEFVKCVKCMCNNQSDICNAQTGACECQFNTEGHNCEKCLNGYYGDPTTQVRNICKPCGCPGGTACELVKNAADHKVVCTECPDNLGGYRCDRCRDNYFGNPRMNISCKLCDCHGSTDYFSSCDSITGKCSNCIFNTDGDYCETCKLGYYLVPNERAPNRCRRCICNPFGSDFDGNVCNINTGQCLCKPLVTGHKCDQCESGYFNLSLSKTCQSCNCFVPGSTNQTCNQHSGQCHCKPGVTGLRCDQCEFGFYNLSVNGCQNCLCDSEGSTSLQCNSKSGQCSCKPNVIGMKCNLCMENFYNLTSDGCQPCSPCYGLIQKRINKLKYDISSFMDSNSSIYSTDYSLLNDSTTMIMIRQYEGNLLNLLGNFSNYIENLKDLKTELPNTNSTMTDLEKEIRKLANNNSNEKLKEIINNITNMENMILTLYEKDFNKSLELLTNYIKNKNDNNEKVTQMAVKAHEDLAKAMKDKEMISNIWKTVENHVNKTLKNVIEINDRYHKYMSASSGLKVKELKELSEKVNTESMNNLIDIYEIKKNLDFYEKKINNGKNELESLLTLIKEYSKSFSDGFEKLRTIEEQFKNFVRRSGELDTLESVIKSETNMFGRKSGNFSVVQKMLEKLNEGKNNLTRAMKKANDTLIVLQDFNEVVNKSKYEAEDQVKKIEGLRTKLDNIKLDIKALNSTYFRVISGMKTNDNRSITSHKEARSLHSNSENLGEQVKRLLNKTEELQEVQKVKELSEEKYKENKLSLEKLANLSKELKVSENMFKNQKDTGKYLEEVLNEILGQLSSMNNNSKTINDNKLAYYSQKIDNLSNQIDNYFQKEFDIVSRDELMLNQEWKDLTAELDFTEKEINRLELINDHMVEVKQNVCYKSGGKTEG